MFAEKTGRKGLAWLTEIAAESHQIAIIYIATCTRAVIAWFIFIINSWH
jgi:hypothetical protein